MKYLLTIDYKAFVSSLANIFEKLNILNKQFQGTNKILVLILLYLLLSII